MAPVGRTRTSSFFTVAVRPAVGVSSRGPSAVSGAPASESGKASSRETIAWVAPSAETVPDAWMAELPVRPSRRTMSRLPSKPPDTTVSDTVVRLSAPAVLLRVSAPA